jgi:hypothetical protein
VSDIFPILFAAHMLGDWVIQTDKQAMAKMTSWPAMAGHVLTYHLCMAALVLPFSHDRWALLGLVISAATHGFIDRRWPVRWLLRKTGSANFSELQLGVLSADQALHAFFLEPSGNRDQHSVRDAPSRPGVYSQVAPYFFANRRSPRQRHLRPRLASDLPLRSA